MGHVDEFCIANAAGATARRCPRSSTRRQKRVVGLPQGKSLGSSNFGGLIPPINQWNMWNWWVNYSQNTSNLQHPAIVSSIVNRNVKNYILGGFSSCGSSRQSVDLCSETRVDVCRIAGTVREVRKIEQWRSIQHDLFPNRTLSQTWCAPIHGWNQWKIMLDTWSIGWVVCFPHFCRSWKHQGFIRRLNHNFSCNNCHVEKPNFHW